MRCAALNTGPDFHLLDHIAPLADLLKCPLLVTEEKNEELAKRYYPQVSTRFIPDLEFRLKEIAEQFDALFECKYWQPHLKLLFQTLYNKEMQLIFCPHGQSDKGYQAPLLAPYSLQDGVLVYGPLMLQMLKELQIEIPKHKVVGNYRLAFYQKYRSFYDGLLPKLDRSMPTLLYAPTWRDLDGASSFFEFGTKVFSELPKNWNLIVKLHPLLRQRDPHSLEPLLSKTLKPNIFLIEEFPPVYPLLSIADLYLGDASSIGYDFLYFQKPLYFFPTKKLGRLHACGTIIDTKKNLYSQLDIVNRHKEKQMHLYTHAFISPVSIPPWEG